MIHHARVERPDLDSTTEIGREPTLDALILYRLLLYQGHTPKQLARILSVRAESVRRSLRVMERAGLVIRERAQGPWRVVRCTMIEVIERMP